MRELFQKYFGEVPEKSGHIRCIFHNDSKASLYLNYEEGTFYCFGCGKTGNIKELLEENKTKILDQSIWQNFHENLLREKEALSLLMHVRGFTLETIKKYKIGYNGQRYCYPVFDEHGNCINIRLYSFQGDPKWINFEKDYGKPSWFPFPPKDDMIVYLMEGENDCLLARQLGLAAYTQTAGARHWDENFNVYLKNKIVYIIYDIDRAGQEGAKNVLAQIRNIVKECKIIKLPICGSLKDFSDWILKGQGSIGQLNEIIENTAGYVKGKEIVEVSTATKISFDMLGQREYARKPIEVEAVVAATDKTTYLLPSKVRILCSYNAQNKNCRSCPVSLDHAEFELSVLDGEITQLVEITKVNKTKLIRDIIGIPSSCKTCRIEELECINIEKIGLCDKMKLNAVNPVKCYFLGHGIKDNACYLFRGIIIPDPKTQEAVLYAIEVEPANELTLEYDASILEFWRVTDYEDYGNV